MGLFGEDVTHTRKRAEKPKSDGRVALLEAAYIERHQARWGVTPFRKSIGFERKLIKGWAEQATDTELLALMDLYFDQRVYQQDDVVRRSNFTFKDFDRVLPHLRLLRVKRQERAVGGRTAANIEAAQRAVGRKP